MLKRWKDSLIQFFDDFLDFSDVPFFDSYYDFIINDISSGYFTFYNQEGHLSSQIWDEIPRLIVMKRYFSRMSGYPVGASGHKGIDLAV